MMESAHFTAYLKRQQFSSTLLWAALTVAVILYWVVAVMMEDSGALKELAENSASAPYVPLVRQLALPVCVVLAALSLGIGRHFLNPEKIQQALGTKKSTEELATGKNGQLDQRQFQLLSDLNAVELPACNLIPLYLNAMLSRLILAEGIGLYGFVLALFAGDANVVLPYVAASLVLMALAFPRLPSFVRKQQNQTV